MAIVDLTRFIHSWNRWAIVLVVAISLIYFTNGWIQGKLWTKLGQTLLTIFSSLVGLQWILGLILLISYGSTTGFGIRYYWEHLTIQTIALAVAHMHMSWRKRDFDDKTRYKRGFLLLTSVFVIIIIGIVVLPAGIQWRFLSI